MAGPGKGALVKAYRITKDGPCRARFCNYDPTPFPCPKDLQTDKLPPGAYLILRDNFQHKMWPNE
jgi:hypothetical protein